MQVIHLPYERSIISRICWLEEVKDGEYFIFNYESKKDINPDELRACYYREGDGIVDYYRRNDKRNNFDTVFFKHIEKLVDKVIVFTQLPWKE